MGRHLSAASTSNSNGNEGIQMGIIIDAKKCTGCMACEMACGYHRDDGFALLSSCIMAYRTKEKKDYFGVILKREEELVVARPEGTDIKRIGEIQDGCDSAKPADASAKPLLLREACDLCEEMDLGPLCVKFCPVGAISEA
jgi:Fe-S-cluster-containing dehydrogenase component